MDLEQYGFKLLSDFDIRILREDEVDIDLIISLDYRTLDLYFDDIPIYFGNRIQCSMIKNIVIRLSKLNNNSLCTVHFLRNIDLHSSVINFEVDYKCIRMEIMDSEHSVEFRIIKYKLGR